MDEDGDTSLYQAAKDGDTEAIAALLAAGADPDEQDKVGRTPLHLATWNGHAEAVAALLAAGADPNAQNQGGETPLHGFSSIMINVVGIRNEQNEGWDIPALSEEAVTALLAARADPDEQDEDGYTRLPLRAGRGRGYPAALCRL